MCRPQCRIQVIEETNWKAINPAAVGARLVIPVSVLFVESV